jgi:hypothetical protein
MPTTHPYPPNHSLVLGEPGMICDNENCPDIMCVPDPDEGPARYCSCCTAALHLSRLEGAWWAREGEYGLSQEAASVFWYLHDHGIWEASPTGAGFLNAPGYADFRMTCDSFIQSATSLDEESVRRGLDELEEKQFIRRTPWFYKNGMQANDPIQFTMPDDWCLDCWTATSAAAGTMSVIPGPACVVSGVKRR